ncbi:MAG: potassium-transporting ATPase subunit KdpA [Haliscomenobacteraceae bacterium CHB4]|nr:Potassium-transporting ATPase potassium-binding subunit [Saprospiraceae bacterium]MCE7925223.1 potassium-transporting ATPase subunit KdpA [Haliscomenobacteraceae bacterium CHB4]
MNTELSGVLAIFLIAVLLAIPLGRYIARVYLGERTLLDPILGPVENLFFRLSRIDNSREMTWQEHLKALLSINLVWFLFTMFILMNMAWLPLNPDGNPSMTPDLAFNTSISFVVNCNLQHYSGETGLSYLGQLSLMFQQFVSAGTGMAAAAIVFNTLRARQTTGLGNFWDYFAKSTTRILLPVAFIGALVLIFRGSPMTFEGKDTMITLQGDTVQVSSGPAAGMIAIKQAGTNGGGYYGVNSAHPLENPDYLTNMIENILILLIPIAMVFALGFYLKRRKLAWMVMGVMTLGYLLLLAPTVYFEMNGNPAISQMGVSEPTGSMEGKEIRHGAAASALWAISTTVTSNGSVNAMHDSTMPLSGMHEMLGMMVNSFYGGVGVGFLNFYIFIIIAVFISGLMVGRTPEFMGKKVEAREVKIAMFTALLSPLLIMGGTALAAWMMVHYPSLPWLNNPGFHGFSEMLYEYTSSNANNGSGFEGLGDNNPFWNISTGIVLILGRFIPIIGPVAIAGLLAGKKYIPESAGTLKTDTLTFGIMVFSVIFIVTALCYFPALALGPLAEYFSM